MENAPSSDKRTQELLQGRPSSHIENIFPRKFLFKGENVIFETRQGLGSIIRHSIEMVISLVILGLAYYYIAYYYGYYIGGFLPFIGYSFVFIAIIVILAFILSVLGVLNTRYALTDKRLIMKYGVLRRNLTDMKYEKVSSINMKQGIINRLLGVGDIAFFASGGSIGRFKRILIRGAGGVFWKHVKEPVKIRSFLEEASEILVKIHKEEDYREMAKNLNSAKQS